MLSAVLLVNALDRDYPTALIATLNAPLKEMLQC